MTRRRSLLETPEYKATHLGLVSVPAMREQAILAAQEGYSHRGFRVGTSALAYNTRTGTSTTVTGGNIKVHSAKEKVCSEQVALGKITRQNRNAGREVERRSEPREDFDFLGLIVVAGTVDRAGIKSVTKFETTTLWPCVSCTTGVFEENELVLPDTPVVTVGIEQPYWQVHTPRALKVRHQEGVDVASQYGFENWDKRIKLFEELVGARAEHPTADGASISLLAVRALSANIASDY